ncbi:hypothetical protein HUK80_11185 [Flavobacterium sp. MAH-1]|uniref:Uncharacterized protein n=1 Tax=Flavobacterium agri TaxID=2743471 RepID=A0A7Y8Y2S2_9FLAO|nr:hypothetical protein [Flavobacterium agri]NUY81462.1 hypothetical protein [Flavobacterium agri]NYA71486.1 hypothetical protein [Flavobacterium agri]
MQTKKVDSGIFDADPTRFTLVEGSTPGAPLCPYGNHFSLVGYDNQEKKFVRYTKSVYKRLVEKRSQTKNHELHKTLV